MNETVYFAIHVILSQYCAWWQKQIREKGRGLLSFSSDPVHYMTITANHSLDTMSRWSNGSHVSGWSVESWQDTNMSSNQPSSYQVRFSPIYLKVLFKRQHSLGLQKRKCNYYFEGLLPYQPEKFQFQFYYVYLSFKLNCTKFRIKILHTSEKLTQFHHKQTKIYLIWKWTNNDRS